MMYFRADLRSMTASYTVIALLRNPLDRPECEYAAVLADCISNRINATRPAYAQPGLDNMYNTSKSNNEDPLYNLTCLKIDVL
jgi:hypothetical protein